MVAAAAALIVWISGAPPVYDELDLAEVTAALHTQRIAGGDAPLATFANSNEVDEYFRRELSPNFCLNIDTSGSMSLRGGKLCELGGVRAAHIVCADSASTVSLFWMPSDRVGEFPETVSRFQSLGASFHCHVDPYEFYVKRAGEGIVVGVAETTPTEIERLVGEAAGTDCGGNL